VFLNLSFLLFVSSFVFSFNLEIHSFKARDIVSEDAEEFLKTITSPAVYFLKGVDFGVRLLENSIHRTMNATGKYLLSKQHEGFCFTLVKLKNGYLPIEFLSIGDKVLCFDNNGNICERKITMKKIVTSRWCYKFVLPSGETIYTGGNQKYLHRDGEIIKAKDFYRAGYFLSHNGVEYLPIPKHCEDTSYSKVEANLYQIDVEEFHNFFVSKLDICTVSTTHPNTGVELLDDFIKNAEGGAADVHREVLSHEIEGFTAETLIKVKDGYRRICELKAGEMVLCLNEKGEVCESPIIGKCAAYCYTCQRHAIHGCEDTLVTGTLQKFYTTEKGANIDDGWVMAKDSLHKPLLSLNGFSEIYSQDPVRCQTIVFGIKVAEYHNFFVTKKDILTHNFPGFGMVYVIPIGAKIMEVAYPILATIASFYAAKLISKCIPINMRGGTNPLNPSYSTGQGTSKENSDKIEEANKRSTKGANILSENGGSLTQNNDNVTKEKQGKDNTNKDQTAGKKSRRGGRGGGPRPPKKDDETPVLPVKRNQKDESNQQPKNSPKEPANNNPQPQELSNQAPPNNSHKNCENQSCKTEKNLAEQKALNAEQRANNAENRANLELERANSAEQKNNGEVVEHWTKNALKRAGIATAGGGLMQAGIDIYNYCKDWGKNFFSGNHNKNNDSK